eukprot:jgi/Chlat1/4230/Chrsp27S04248
MAWRALRRHLRLLQRYEGSARQSKHSTDQLARAAAACSSHYADGNFSWHALHDSNTASTSCRTFASAALSEEEQAAIRRRLLSSAERRKRIAAARRQAGAARARDAAPSSAASTPTPATSDPSSPTLNTALSHLPATAPPPPLPAALATIVARPALVVTRGVEWGNVVLGFEHATRYTICDETGQVVGLIAEEQGSIATAVGRQLLARRRPFTSTVMDATGNVIFRVRRPVKLINSRMYVEDPQGTVVGEIMQRWHPIRRKYDMYFNKQQFGSIDGGFLTWEFEVQDQHGQPLAVINRNWSNFGRELFTDAGCYVVHLGDRVASTGEEGRLVHEPEAELRKSEARPAVTSASAAASTVNDASTTSEGAVVTSATGATQLMQARATTLAERSLILAAAITVDYDFFSRHSGMHGGFMPIPIPLGGGEARPEGETGAEAGAGAAGAAAGAGAAADVGAGQPGSSPEGAPGPSGGDNPDAGGYGFGNPSGGAWGDEWRGDDYERPDDRDSDDGDDMGDGGDDEGGGGWGEFLGNFFPSDE